MTVNGIDVASYQDSSFPTVGLGFVFIKVTEGTNYINPKWQQQRDHARAAGLVVGYYHYAQGVKNLAEADHFLSQVTLAPGEMLAFDWEDSDVSNAEKDAWLKYVQAKVPNHRVLLYCNLSYWLNRDDTSFCGDGLWIADPSAPAGHPRVQHAWTVHQYSEAGGIDRNVANFADKAALQAWAAKGAKPPAPKPGKVDLSNAARAFSDYPHNPASVSVMAIQRGLTAEGLYGGAVDGIAGPKTKTAYRAWQKRCGYTGTGADGIPGKSSLVRLGQKHAFVVVA